MSAQDFFDVHSKGRIIGAEARQKMRDNRKESRRRASAAGSSGGGSGGKGPREAVIKLATWGKTPRAAQHSVAYITRTRPSDNPALALTATDQNGNQVPPDRLREVVEGWKLKANADNLSPAAKAADPATRAGMTEQERYKSRQTGHLILSMPPHAQASQDQVHDAAKAALEEIFGKAGVEYLFVVHTDHSARPHAHVVFKATTSRGRQVRIQPDDLRVMRAIFAEKSTEVGVPLVATAREDRSDLALSIAAGELPARTGKTYYDIKAANSLDHIHWLAKQAPIYYDRHGADYQQRLAGLVEIPAADPQAAAHALAAATVLSEPSPATPAAQLANDNSMAAPAEAIDPLSPLAILDTLNAKSAVFDHAAIEREIAKHTRDQEAAAQALAAVLQRPDLVQLTPTPESKEAPPAKYAMQATIELENRMLDTAERLHARASHDVESGAFKAAVAQYEAQAGHQLSDEQKEAAQHITEAGGLRAVVGLPGTGKTTMLTAARMAWEGAGYQVRGAALAGIAADNLAQSGIKSSTIAALLLRIDEQEDLHPLATTGEMTDAAVTRFARHLEREIERADNAESTAILQAWRDELMTGQLSQEAADYARAWATDTQRFAPLDTNTVLVIDEAGMIGSAQMARLLDAVEGTGAKIILVGDPEQIQPIEIGGAFRAIFQSTEGVTLEDVRRQRVEWMRAATKDISRGPADRAITAYDEAGAIHARINADRAETLGKLKTEHEITPEDERRINTIIDYVEARRAAGAAFRLIKEQSNDPLATLFYEFKEDRDSAAATIAADIEGYKPWLARFAINGEHLAADILVTENMSRRQAVEKAAGHAESIGILDIEKSLLPEDRYGLDLRSGAKRDLAAAWLADYQSAPDLSRIVLTHTNEDAADLNARIREGLKIIGVLQGEEIATVTEEGARTFMTGDRILFRRTHRFGASQDAVGVRNGTLGTISSTARASDGEIAFTVTLDGGQTFTFSPDEFDGYAPGYAVTTHKAQGVTVDRSFVLASLGMNKHLLGVAMSRHRDTTALFAATGDAASPSQVAKIAGKAERAETTIDYLREAAPAPAARFAEMHGIEASTTERTMDSRTWADRRRQWVAEQGTRLSKTWQAFRQQVQHRAQATLQPSQHAPNPIEMPALTARAQLALHKTFRAYADPTEARQRFLEMYAEKAGLAVWAVNNRPEVFGTGRAGERVSTFEPREAQISKAWRTEAARRLSVATPRAPLVAKAVAQAERSARRIAGDRQIARGREFSRNIARRAADRFGAMPGMTQTPQPRGPEPTPQAPAEAGTPRTSWWDRIRGRGRVPAETPNAPGTPAADKPAAATPAKAEPHWSERITAPRQKPGSQELRQLIARDLREIHAAKATDPMRAAAAREALAVHTQQLTERQIKAYPPKAQEEIRVVRRMNPQLNYGPARRRDRDKDIER